MCPGNCERARHVSTQECGASPDLGALRDAASSDLGALRDADTPLSAAPLICELPADISIKVESQPWLEGLSGWSAGLRTKGSPVRFPVRVHAWVAGQVPRKGHVRGNHTLMFLPLSFSLPSPLCKNKQINSFLRKQSYNFCHPLNPR